MLRASDLEYDLPPERIARRPAEPRDSSRLLVISRTDERVLEHRRFSDLHEFLAEGDLLVTNRSGVIPARFGAVREDSGGGVAGLYLDASTGRTWRAMLKANGRLREGAHIRLLSPAGEPTEHVFRLLEKDRQVWTLEAPGGVSEILGILERFGRTPLPPYILAARRSHEDTIDDALDRAWYQTVYALDSAGGSVAAPTAGLHFTDQLLRRITEKGVELAEVILHVGAGTFAPIDVDDVSSHPIHGEDILVPARTTRLLSGRRAIAVGTTTVRAIESIPKGLAPGEALRSHTELFITPGHEFRCTEGLITNFHLPRSTLLAMVGAFLPGGVSRLLEVYRGAIESGYRFYSYGDAMLILP